MSEPQNRKYLTSKKILEAMKTLLSSVQISQEDNAVYGIDDLNRRIMHGAIHNASVGGCANATRNAGKKKKVSTDKWCANMAKTADTESIQNALHKSVKDHLKKFKSSHMIPLGGITMR